MIGRGLRYEDQFIEIGLQNPRCDIGSRLLLEGDHLAQRFACEEEKFLQEMSQDGVRERLAADRCSAARVRFEVDVDHHLGRQRFEFAL